MIGLVAATANGAANARHLESAWTDAKLYEGPVRDSLGRAWSECDGIVLFLATGAAVRLVSELLHGKSIDPGVVTVDDAARFAVSLCGGHEGGGNGIALRVADSLGAEPVITTASEAVESPPLGSLGADLGFRVEDGSDLASVGRAVVSGEKVHLVSESRWPLGPLPENVMRVEKTEEGTPAVIVSDRVRTFTRPSVVYRPPSLAVGIGCSRGASSGEILGLLRTSLADAGLSEKSVAHLASVEAKRDEAGLHEAADELGLGLEFHTAEELSAVEVPNPSEAAMSAVGTPSVSEAAALSSGSSGGDLLVQKRKSPNATVAVVRMPVRGRLYLISLGPGEGDLIPALAREALAGSELVVGLDQYIGRIRHILRPGTRVETPPLGSEVERAETAIAEARDGGSAALVSSGDIGVYAMGSPALEALGADEGVDVVSVPGVTAANAAASLLGSPLGHDHCSISLSDLLTPWEAIERRIEAAGAGDFVVSLYNPRSRGRDWQLGKAREILLDHRTPETPVGLVTDAYRPTQEVKVTDLGSLRVEDVGMLTIVIVGSSQTRMMGGRVVTPRGYALRGDS